MSLSVLKAYKRMTKSKPHHIVLSRLERHEKPLLEHHPRSIREKGVSFWYSINNSHNGSKYVLAHYEK